MGSTTTSNPVPVAHAVEGLSVGPVGEALVGAAFDDGVDELL